MKQILRIDASARYKNSYSRALTDRLMNRLTESYPGAHVVTRNIYTDTNFLSEAMVNGLASPANATNDELRLAASDLLIDELISTDILVLAVPVYNFSIPAALKAYIDMVVRAGRTFRYDANGPQGLVEGLTVYVVVTSNGTPLRGEGDFASTWLEFVLRFIGVSDIQCIDATQLLLKGAQVVTQQAENTIDQLALPQDIVLS
jgi:FMN-dependent NADH-azoreductase